MKAIAKLRRTKKGSCDGGKKGKKMVERKRRGGRVESGKLRSLPGRGKRKGRERQHLPEGERKGACVVCDGDARIGVSD